MFDASGCHRAIYESIKFVKKELEEAMKPKTCKGCVHEVGDMQDLHCAFCSLSCDDNFEAKDNA